jgi:hypothetical protein
VRKHIAYRGHESNFPIREISTRHVTGHLWHKAWRETRASVEGEYRNIRNHLEETIDIRIGEGMG